MAIVAADILRKLSVKTGAAGNSTAGTPAGSLGKYVSTTQVDTGTPNGNLFDAVSGDEALAGTIEYRCVFVHNAHATLTLQAPKAWITAETAGGGSIAMGVDPTAASALGAAGAQAVQVATETDAPAGVTFTAPTTKGAGISLSDIPAGQVKAVWFRRTVPAGASPIDSDGFTWRVEGDTAA